jgi:hypothetical protein
MTNISHYLLLDEPGQVRDTVTVHSYMIMRTMLTRGVYTSGVCTAARPSSTRMPMCGCCIGYQAHLVQQPAVCCQEWCDLQSVQHHPFPRASSLYTPPASRDLGGVCLPFLCSQQLAMHVCTRCCLTSCLLRRTDVVDRCHSTLSGHSCMILASCS